MRQTNLWKKCVQLITVVGVMLGVVTAGWAAPIKLDLTTSHPFLLQKNSQKTYIKIGLTGLVMKRKAERAPLNLAIVLDRSTSMTGVKLQKAKDAAKLALDLLGPNDIVSVVSYDSKIEVLMPATKLTESSRTLMKRKIDEINARGWTALHGGVTAGIMEVKKFLSKKRVNRVILLSDGQANVGPTKPAAMRALANMSAKLGVAITTVGLGLGYNEDIMTTLAQNSDGNHGFAKTGADLQRIFQSELGNLIAVVAQDIKVTIQFPSHIRPIRSLDRSISIVGQKAMLKWNQLYSRQNKYLIMEVEVKTSKATTPQQLANVRIQYNDMKTNKAGSVAQDIKIAFTESTKQVQQHRNKLFMAEVVEAIANELTKKIVKLRDQGKVKQAKAMLLRNAKYLKKMSISLKSKKLMAYSKENLRNAKNISGRRWNRTRKGMRKSQYSISNQMTW